MLWCLIFGLAWAAAAYGQNSANPKAPISLDSRPNIVFILTDDQDLHLGSLDYMPLLRKHLVEQGTSYKRHFCTIAICCPSRVSLWTGQAAHNTNVTDVSPPYGGYPKFISQGYNDNWLPVWLQEAGYNTYYTGKLFNAHTTSNYDSPFIKGFTGSDFLLDPFTYQYLNSSFQRNHDPPVNYANQYLGDVLAGKVYGFLDDAVKEDKPFFLTVAPIAPHANVDRPNGTARFAPPIPAERHANLFPNVTVPRTENFNPGNPSGASWIRNLPQQSQENVDYNDEFYRLRLRTIQSVDELVDGVVTRLEQYGILNNTYVIYSTDNGFHIGQHRLQPGKECGYEEDINIPLIVRGPGVPKNEATEIVTSHTDLSPTFLTLADAPLRATFDGQAIPFSRSGLDEAKEKRHEHVNVEFWGMYLGEGASRFNGDTDYDNNTYKAVRIISDSYSLYYSVWCTNEHELYDLKTDPGQLNNLLLNSTSNSTTLLDCPLQKLVARLDSLLFVLKSCKGKECIRPWAALHPQGDVANLQDALSPRFDDFYENQQERISFTRCELGYLLDAEGPQFNRNGLLYREGSIWHHWI
ncbi:Arylsulphatase [Zopfia rhizophila CBS 207.26]|uniref:Arylsulfatase n=1 Tax=Zopfia rhizophila CBS 207.26 TaxID=1314779 RepID=A0A6A6DX03_9PEZI|nr:Arylsulphatase [Zopfia rhizophila CBS 207.26]